MNTSRTKNAIRNIAWGFINKIILTLFPFIVRTLFIYKLGAEYLGLNSLFASILQVLSLSELGFSSAVVYNLYKPLADGDDQTVCALLNFYKGVYRKIGLIILGVGTCLIPFLPRLINGDYPTNINIYILYIIYLLNTSISYFLWGYKNSLLQAAQRADIISNISSFTSMGMYILQIFMLCCFPNYYIYACLIPLCTIANNILVAITAKKEFPHYICKGKISSELKSNIMTKVKGLMISKVCVTTRNSLDSIFLSAFVGLTTVAIYNNYYYIMTSIAGIISIFPTSILAGVGNSIATESVDKNYNDLCKFNFIYMWISGWCSICLLCLFQPWMKIWVGEDLTFPVAVMILFCVYFYILRMGDIKGVYFDATGLWWQARYRSIAESITNCVLNFVLAKYFGVTGILIATIASVLVINFGYGSQIIFKHYFGKEKMKKFFMENLIYFFCTCIAGIATYSICNMITGDNIASFFLKICVCIPIPNLIYLLLYFKHREFKIASTYVINMLRRERS